MSSIVSTAAQGKKCGHCREVGHHIGQCVKEREFAEDVHQEALNQLNRDIHERTSFDRFEFWIRHLINAKYKSLHKLVLQARAFLTERNEHTDNEILRYFEAQNIGYQTKITRVNLLYTRIETVLQNLLETPGNNIISLFHQYLRSLNYTDTILVFRHKIVGNQNNRHLGLALIQRERENYNIQNRHSREFMLEEVFQIHCHFAEKYGYEFRVQEIPNYVDPDTFHENPHLQNRIRWILNRDTRRENHRLQRAQVYRAQTMLEGIYYPADGSLPLLEPTPAFSLNPEKGYQLRINRVIRVPNTRLVSRDLEIQKKILLFSEESNDYDCSVCMETKIPKEFIITGCYHAFCGTCMANHMKASMLQNKSTGCPLCRTEVESINYQDFSVIQHFCTIVHSS